MQKKRIIDDISINTIVGPGSEIKGDIHTVSGFLRIDGDIHGNVTTEGRIIIGENARIRGNISAQSVSIGGVVHGDIIAPDYVTILSSGMVIGTILTKKIRIDENVILHGFCSAVNDNAHFEEAEKIYYNKRAIQSSLPYAK